MRRELPGVAVVTAIVVLAMAYLTAGGILTGQDAATQFYPWYGFLGEGLRAGRIPEWNPSQFAGAPFAADPQSGWTYVPAMVLFTLLPRVAAIVAFLAFHLWLAGVACWALARLIGISRVGALVAAVAYMGSGVMLGRLPCCPASYELATWVPVSLAGVEVAVQSRSWRGRVVGWSITGVALSQVLAVWLGQGAYYVLLLTGAYLAYRTLLDPPDAGAPLARWHDRFALLALHGAVVLVIGFGLAAAGILPRLEYNTVSNVAGGVYQGSGAAEAQVGGASSEAVISRIFQPSLYYPGAVCLALAVAAVVLVGRRHAARFWLGLAIITVVLAIPATTPVHWLFYLLPRFEALHGHWPERVVLITYIAPAMLAGGMVSSLGERHPPARAVVAATLPLTVLLGFVVLGATVPIAVPLAVGTASLLVLVSTRSTGAAAGRTIPLALLLLIGVDAAVANRGLARDAPFGGYHRMAVGAFDEPPGSALFLQGRMAGEGPFRFAGYDPALAFVEDGQPVLYRYQFASHATRSLLVNNAATTFGLEDVQGYNPIQILTYAEYVAALNGTAQEYHGANILPAGLDSALLDQLNLRYLIVPATVSPERMDLPGLLAEWEVVYADADVRVLRNPRALPRGWVVHDVRGATAEDALAMVASRAVDPRRTALVQGPLPPVEAANGSGDRVDILPSADADEMRVRVRTEAAGFLVLSEIAYPGWRATVDGEPVLLATTNGALRGLAVPAGDHLVELRLDSAAMRWGVWISALTLAILVGALLVTWRRESGAGHGRDGGKRHFPGPAY